MYLNEMILQIEILILIILFSNNEIMLWNKLNRYLGYKFVFFFVRQLCFILLSEKGDDKFVGIFLFVFNSKDWFEDSKIQIMLCFNCLLMIFISIYIQFRFDLV